MGDGNLVCQKHPLFPHPGTSRLSLLSSLTTAVDVKLLVPDIFSDIHVIRSEEVRVGPEIGKISLSLSLALIFPGKGNFGTVFLADWTTKNMKVAVKEIKVRPQQ